MQTTMMGHTPVIVLTPRQGQRAASARRCNAKQNVDDDYDDGNAVWCKYGECSS